MTGVTKTIRLSGGSSNSIEDAITTVLGRAALTIADIASFEVVKLGGTVSDSGLPESYDVTLDITFGVRESVHG
ncbi:MAG TPA: dodecin family protein [Acidimicrobiia bacterium]|jgi:flavin-binding protein dodecin